MYVCSAKHSNELLCIEENGIFNTEITPIHQQNINRKKRTTSPKYIVHYNMTWNSSLQSQTHEKYSVNEKEEPTNQTNHRELKVCINSYLNASCIGFVHFIFRLSEKYKYRLFDESVSIFSNSFSIEVKTKTNLNPLQTPFICCTLHASYSIQFA